MADIKNINAYLQNYFSNKDIIGSRKLKAIVQKLLKKRGAISKDYTYIVFGKSNAYAQKHDVLLPLMEKSFSKLEK